METEKLLLFIKRPISGEFKIKLYSFLFSIHFILQEPLIAIIMFFESILICSPLFVFWGTLYIIKNLCISKGQLLLYSNGIKVPLLSVYSFSFIIYAFSIHVDYIFRFY